MLVFAKGGAQAFLQSLKQGLGSRAGGNLENEALLLLLLPGGESSTGGVLKHFPDTLVGLGRALDVLLGTNLVLDLSRLPGGVSIVACSWWSSPCRRCTNLLLGDGRLRRLV